MNTQSKLLKTNLNVNEGVFSQDEVGTVDFFTTYLQNQRLYVPFEYDRNEIKSDTQLNHWFEGSEFPNIESQPVV